MKKAYERDEEKNMKSIKLAAVLVLALAFLSLYLVRVTTNRIFPDM